MRELITGCCLYIFSLMMLIGVAFVVWLIVDVV